MGTRLQCYVTVPGCQRSVVVLHDGALLGFVESLQWPVVVMGHNSLVGAGLGLVQHAHFSQPLHFFLYLPRASGGPAQTLPVYSCLSRFACVLKSHPNCISVFFPWIPFILCSAPSHLSVTKPTSSYMARFTLSTT